MISFILTAFFITDEPNHIQNSRLLRGILSRIKGQAQIQVGNFEYATWPQLEEKLTEFFGDRKTDRTLTIELCRMSQNSSEKAIDFYNRVTYQLNLVVAFMNTHRRLAHKDFIHEWSLQVFLRGLRDPLRRYLKARNPLTLAEALNLMTNEFQFENLDNYKDGNSSGSSQKKPNQNFQNKSGNKNNQFQNYAQQNKGYGNQGQNKPNFQNQNKPNYSNQNKPNFQNKSNFNQNRGSNQKFNQRPSGSNNVPTNQPIPMSGISHAHVTDVQPDSDLNFDEPDNDFFVEDVPEEMETTPFFQIEASPDRT